MPELPEVETVKKGLELLHSQQGGSIERIECRRKDLRYPLPVKELKKFAGAKILGFRRRAKYILVDTDKGQLLSHLGMSGYWRNVQVDEPLRTHDHIVIHFQNGCRWVYNDPRRFGMFFIVTPAIELKFLAELGIEPLASEFSGDYLSRRARGKSQCIKNFIMDQKVVVGVGNIYASEALFRAHIRPDRPVKNVTKLEFSILVQAIQDVLSESIQAGGSSISDFLGVAEQSGYFQTQFQVYGHEGELCRACSSKIRNSTLGGRSSFWCPSCQK